MGFAELVAATVAYEAEAEVEAGSSGSRARASFQWGGTIFALILLILNRAGRRSAMQSSLLVLFLFMSFPTVLFKILRGQLVVGFPFLLLLQTSSFLKLFQFLGFSYLSSHLIWWQTDCAKASWAAAFV